MDEEMITVEILRLMNKIADADYGSEKMTELQKQLHSLMDLQNKMPKKRSAKDWFWENSKPLIAFASATLTTVVVVGNEHFGPILSKAFGFISKPRI